MLNITVTAFIFHENKLLLVFHKKLRKWMHVGGHVEKNELFDEALKREIREEVGLEVQILDAHPITLEYDKRLATPLLIQGNEKDGIKDISIDYVCKVIGDPSIRLQEDELADYKWVTMNELESLDTFDVLKKIAREAYAIYCENE